MSSSLLSRSLLRLSSLSTSATSLAGRRVLPAAASRQWTTSPMSAVSTVRCMASKADDSLTKFLVDEIAAEKKNQRPLPNVGGGFKVEADGADLKFVKETQGEKVTVQLNVNHTVDSAEPDDGTQEAPEMKSKPNFEVDVTRGGKTLSFSCSFIPDVEGQEQQQQQGEDFADIFAIDEVTIFEGEWNETKYAVAGDILDGYLYDLFMGMLEERGVSGEFVDQLSAYCSAYEHSQYINMLNSLQSFVK